MEPTKDDRPDWVKNATEDERKDAQRHSDAEDYE